VKSTVFGYKYTATGSTNIFMRLSPLASLQIRQDRIVWITTIVHDGFATQSSLAQLPLPLSQIGLSMRVTFYLLVLTDSNAQLLACVRFTG
jgi:hypothetical protein